MFSFDNVTYKYPTLIFLIASFTINRKLQEEMYCGEKTLLNIQVDRIGF